MNKKIFNIVSGAKSGALNVAITVGEYLKNQGYQVETILRKYNKTDLTDAVVVKDRCTIDYIVGLAKLIDEARPDIILVHGYSTHLWTKLAVAYAKLDVKLIHVEHNVEKYTLLRSWLVKKLDKYTSKYICVSKGVATHLIKQGVDASKVTVIYNGIDIEKFNIAKKPHDIYTIGMTARFSKQKDQMTLIKAVEQLVKKDKQKIRLILLGEGKTKSICVNYVQKAGLEDSVIFKTGLFTDIIPDLDLFVLSTHYEGLPLVLCEAMAARLPVIATDVAGVNEIVLDGQTGYLVAENDEQALVDKIMYCMNKQASPALQTIISNANKLLIRKFSLTKMCHIYKELLRSLLNDLYKKTR